MYEKVLNYYRCMVSRCLAGLLISPYAQNAQRRKTDLDVVGIGDSLVDGPAANF